jgi:hypothetical protein
MLRSGGYGIESRPLLVMQLEHQASSLGFSFVNKRHIKQPYNK